MTMVVDGAAAPARGEPSRRRLGDLVFIEFADPGWTPEIRRALRELGCLREIAVSGRMGRAWTDPGMGFAVVRTLRSLGLELALLTLQWRREWPHLQPPRTAGPSGAVAPGGGMLTKLVVVTTNPGALAAPR
ncbi:hypothetical protein [Planotetraspora sp. GP83]|uniref:hypothetical protein n=1 Tax=Planotetraspora sp. GP83 TaxID=3156264 RepID=UPI0035158568